MLGEYNLAILASDLCIEIDLKNDSETSEHYKTRSKINIELGKPNEAIEDLKKVLGFWRDDDEALEQNDEFYFNATERVITSVSEEGVESTVRAVPAMVLQLNKDFFKSKVLSSQGKANMVNNNVFKNYFRGLYFD